MDQAPDKTAILEIKAMTLESRLVHPKDTSPTYKTENPYTKEIIAGKIVGRENQWKSHRCIRGLRKE